MKTRILMILALLMCANMLFAQDDVKQVAVYVVENNDIDPNINKVVGAELVSAIKNQKGYKAVERTTQFLNELRKEEQYQQSGNVKDEQISKLGEKLGVDYVCVAEVTNLWGYYISARLVDVETGLVVETAKGSGNFEGDLSKLVSISEQLATDLFGGSMGGGTRTTGGNNGGSLRKGSDFTETVLGINMKMVYVEGGSFMMGCTSEQGGDCESDENTVRRVSVDSYYIGAFEVTQSQWEKVMGTSVTQQRNKANPNWSMYGQGPDYPMYYVSWEEAMAFCQELSRQTGRTYILPTEAQWEYAARGGVKSEGTKYSGSYSIDAVAWYEGNSGSSTHPVGTKRANALGIYDMSGNVWEWCYDWYGDYRTYDTNNPQGPSSGSYRVLRGGSWNFYAQYCRVAYRGRNSPGTRYNNRGFRVALVP